MWNLYLQCKLNKAWKQATWKLHFTDTLLQIVWKTISGLWRPHGYSWLVSGVPGKFQGMMPWPSIVDSVF